MSSSERAAERSSAVTVAEVLGALGGSTADAVWATWIVPAVASAAYVADDAFTQDPELTVMKWGWVLVTLSIGPIGAALYVLSCKEPSPGTHEVLVAPLWKKPWAPPSTASGGTPRASSWPRS